MVHDSSELSYLKASIGLESTVDDYAAKDLSSTQRDSITITTRPSRETVQSRVSRMFDSRRKS